MGNQEEVVPESITLGLSNPTSAVVCQHSSEIARQTLFDINDPSPVHHPSPELQLFADASLEGRGTHLGNQMDFRVVVSRVEWPTYQSIGATSSTFAS